MVTPKPEIPTEYTRRITSKRLQALSTISMAVADLPNVPWVEVEPLTFVKFKVKKGHRRQVLNSQLEVKQKAKPGPDWNLATYKTYILSTDHERPDRLFESNEAEARIHKNKSLPKYHRHKVSENIAGSPLTLGDYDRLLGYISQGLFAVTQYVSNIHRFRN